MQLVGTKPSPAAIVFTGLVVASALLAGCSTNTPAPITDHSSSPSQPTTSQTPQSSRGDYVVQPGDTLYKIALEHGTTVDAIASANSISDPSELKVDQALVIPGSSRDAGKQVAVSQPVDSDSSKSDSSESDSASHDDKTAESDESTSSSEITPKAEPEKPKSADTTKASDANLISWGWPATGEIIERFSTGTKGIDIKGAIGDPVTASANGKVMYAGNGVRGLGNLILLGHSDGFITAYAHNDELLVKTGQEIEKGQKIATLGESDTTSPRLHFEIRRRGTPVNPESYLPAR